MNITTTPSCRVGSQGQTLRYLVKADGATDVVAPASETDCMRVRVAQVRPAGNGVEADVEVTVVDGRPY
ncbi:MAG: hypothetical protein HY876_00335 [Coriobacteriales bacterium]|nr:hypothetical protein [Coriobacteriales bacterium]